MGHQLSILLIPSILFLLKNLKEKIDVDFGFGCL